MGAVRKSASKLAEPLLLLARVAAAVARRRRVAHVPPRIGPSLPCASARPRCGVLGSPSPPFAGGSSFFASRAALGGPRWRRGVACGATRGGGGQPAAARAGHRYHQPKVGPLLQLWALWSACTATWRWVCAGPSQPRSPPLKPCLNPPDMILRPRQVWPTRARRCQR